MSLKVDEMNAVLEAIHLSIIDILRSPAMVRWVSPGPIPGIGIGWALEIGEIANVAGGLDLYNALRASGGHGLVA
jgi:hypothetical protein